MLQAADELLALGCLGVGEHLLVRGPRPAQPDVLPQRAVKEEIILGNEADLPGELLQRQLPDVSPAQGDGAARHIPEPVSYTHLARSGGGQILICTAGEGWYQEEGKDAVSLTPGTVIVIPPEVKHWHGAKADSWFSHIAVEVPGEETANEWLEPVDCLLYTSRCV